MQRNGALGPQIDRVCFHLHFLRSGDWLRFKIHGEVGVVGGAAKQGNVDLIVLDIDYLILGYCIAALKKQYCSNDR